MRPISRAAVVRAMDRRLIDDVGIPAAVLMEHAGHGCADALRLRYPHARRVRVLCGPGNNGGDGYVIARHLAIAGVDVVVSATAPARTAEARTHAEVCARMGLVRVAPDGWTPEVVVDAVLGTGQRGPVELPDVELPAGASLVAIDVPTGVDADTGRVWGGPLTRPDRAIVIGRRKPWLYVCPVPYDIVDIGLERVADGDPEAVETPFGDSWDGGAPPPRNAPPGSLAPDADKWARGHVGVRAGTPEMTGAAVLACMGALHGGAGLVTLFLGREAWARLGALPPEVMVAEPAALDGAAGARCDALVLGPGLGRSADAEVRRRWAEDPRPCVLDADALRALAPLAEAPAPAGPRLLTPHVGEAAALLGWSREAVGEDRFAAAATLARHAPTVLKGACPIVSGDGPLRVHPGWLPQLGTGGSGDVLAGACGALLARHPRAVTRQDIVERAGRAVAMHLAAGRGLHVGAGAGELARALRP